MGRSSVLPFLVHQLSLPRARVWHSYGTAQQRKFGYTLAPTVLMVSHFGLVSPPPTPTPPPSPTLPPCPTTTSSHPPSKAQTSDVAQCRKLRVQGSPCLRPVSLCPFRAIFHPGPRPLFSSRLGRYDLFPFVGFSDAPQRGRQPPSKPMPGRYGSFPFVDLSSVAQTQAAPRPSRHGSAGKSATDNSKQLKPSAALQRLTVRGLPCRRKLRARPLLGRLAAGSAAYSRSASHTVAKSVCVWPSSGGTTRPFT